MCSSGSSIYYASALIIKLDNIQLREKISHVLPNQTTLQQSGNLEQNVRLVIQRYTSGLGLLKLNERLPRHVGERTISQLSSEPGKKPQMNMTGDIPVIP